MYTHVHSLMHAFTSHACMYSVVEQMLRQERDGVEVKLQQLREEMALIDKHLRDQEKKRKEVGGSGGIYCNCAYCVQSCLTSIWVCCVQLEDLEAASVSRVALIEDSIGSLEVRSIMLYVHMRRPTSCCCARLCRGDICVIHDVFICVVFWNMR